MIYGLMHDFDFSLMENQSSEYNSEIMLKVRKGVADGDQFMADCIMDNYSRVQGKTLIYLGIHHAFTGYEGHGKRTGVIVKNEIDAKTLTISLHYAWPSKKGAGHRTTYPINGYLDAFIRKHKSKEYAFGINVNNTSFGDLIDTTSSYVREDKLNLSSFCDGYIYLNAFSSDQGVAIQEGFITPKNIDYARSQLPNPNMRGIMRFLGPKVYTQITGMDADIKYRYRHLY